jgi:hypothetical protein
VEQHQRIAEQPAVLLGDQARGGIAGQEMTEAAPRQAVVLEAALLDLDQRLEVVGDRRADQPGRRWRDAARRALDLGQRGHRSGSGAGRGRALIAPRYNHRAGPGEDGRAGA